MYAYLAGPMRGHRLLNFPAFFSVAAALRGVGHEIINPAERDMAHGIDPSDESCASDFDLAACFRFDFGAIMRAGNVILLPGWQSSRGARAELVVAQLTGARIFEFDSNAPDLLREITLPEPVIDFPERAETPLDPFDTPRT